MRKKDHARGSHALHDIHQSKQSEKFRKAATDHHLSPEHHTGMQMLEETGERIFMMIYPVVGKNVNCNISYDEVLNEYTVQFSAKANLSRREHTRAVQAIYHYLTEQDYLTNLNDEEDIEKKYYYFDWEIQPVAGKVFMSAKHDILKFFTQHLAFRQKAAFDIYTNEAVLPEDHGQALQKFSSRAEKRISRDRTHDQKLLNYVLPRAYVDYQTYLAVSEKIIEAFDNARCDFSQFEALTEEVIKLEERNDPNIEEHFRPKCFLN